MRHLYLEDDHFVGSSVPFQKIGHMQYLIKRVQFWKYRKKRTMGRPVLMLWKRSQPDPVTNIREEEA